MKLFVYGTLKKGGGNYKFLKDSKFIQHYKLKNYILFDLGYGFPYMIPSDNPYRPTEESVYGEVYEVDKNIIKYIDRLEGHPNHYRRTLCNYKDEVASMYIYLGNHAYLPQEAKIVKNGYWNLGDHIKYKIIVDGRKEYDTPDKLVFHMRFFDGDRTPTNKSYMKMVRDRSKKDLNIYHEHIFLMDCIDLEIVEEWS